MQEKLENMCFFLENECFFCNVWNDRSVVSNVGQQIHNYVVSENLNSYSKRLQRGVTDQVCKQRSRPFEHRCQE